MTPEESIQTIESELEAGIALSKCQQCGCMESALQNLAVVLPKVGINEADILADRLAVSLKKLRSIQYSCLGCRHCYPAVAQNAFGFAFPVLSQEAVDLSCEFRAHDDRWPPVVGEYFVLDRGAPVAVSTLANVQLAEDLAACKPEGLAIVGKTETENIGIDKVVKNIITSATIRYLIISGKESDGHLTGRTFLALAKNGVDENGRIIGSCGKRPVLRNVTPFEIEAFRQQVQVVDMIGCEDLDEIRATIEELSQGVTTSCGCSACGEKSPLPITNTSTIIAAEPDEIVVMDKAGYFVIVPVGDMGNINVEHYAYDNSLLHIIEGITASAIYKTIIENGWVTELSHAAYLGRELAKAELSLQHKFRFIQDGA